MPAPRGRVRRREEQGCRRSSTKGCALSLDLPQPLGNQLQIGQEVPANFLATDIVFVGLIVIATLAYSLSAGMRWLERRLVPWKGKL